MNYHVAQSEQGLLVNMGVAAGTVKRAAAALAIFLWLGGCSRKPFIQYYENNGVRFSHYSDWSVVKDAPSAENSSVRAINIEGPRHAVVVLICEPLNVNQSLSEFASAVARARIPAIENQLSLGPLKAASVEQGTSEQITGKVAGREREGILQRFSVNLLNTEVPHEAQFYLVNGSRFRVMVLYQVPEAHRDEVVSGSTLILESLSIEGAT